MLSTEKKALKIPASYRCSITNEIMIDPVFTEDGHTYEREAIEEWLKAHDTSPKTNERLRTKALRANREKKEDIDEFLSEHPALYKGDELYLVKALVKQFVAAIKTNQIKVVGELLIKDSRLFTLKLEGEYTAFNLACQFGSPELVKMLYPTSILDIPKIILEKEVASKISLQDLGRLARTSKGIHFLLQESLTLTKLLKHVAFGEQDQAEEMLKKAPELALVSGDVTDHAKRTFKNITGFQYAVWALDWHMWTMLRKYLPIDAAREQAKGFGEGSWVKEHGEYASWKRLLEALQTIRDNYNKWDYKKCNEYWVQQVGGAQLILPMHVLQEYCHPTRSFDPCPKFRDSSKLSRSLSKDVDLKMLGSVEGIARGGYGEVCVGRYINAYGIRWELDRTALARLSSTHPVPG